MSRTIVMTGVSRGLGRALLEGFSAAGHTVHGCARNATTIEELQRTFAAPHSFQRVDVADDDQVQAWAQTLVGQGIVPDLLVNNAALINPSATLWETTPDDFSSLVGVNITGVYHVIRHFVPAMIDVGTGVIINFSSGWGRSTSPEVVPYCASKWAIEGLSRGLAQELPRGLACVALNPGIIHTDMLDSCFGASASSFPSPGQWANASVPFLLGLSESDNGRSLDVPST